MIASFQSVNDLHIVIPLAPNGSLLDLLEVNKTLNQSKVKHYSSQIISCLNWFHDVINWCHRDIKPQNILLLNDDHLLLTDFGASTTFDSTKRKCLKSDCLGLIGTTDYVAPEILLSAEEFLIADTLGNSINIDMNSPGPYGPEVDWWSLGVLIFELTFGITPFFAESVGETYNKIRKRDYNTFNDNIKISSDLRNLIDNLLNSQSVRLGLNSTNEIKNHKFFNGIDWNKLSNRKLNTTYFDSKLDSICDDDSFELQQKNQSNKAFDFSELFQITSSTLDYDQSSSQVNQKSINVEKNNDWIGFTYIPTVEDLFPIKDKSESGSPQTPFKLSFNNVHSTKGRNVSEEQAWEQMAKCVGLSAKKRLNYVDKNSNNDNNNYLSDVSSSSNESNQYLDSPLKLRRSESNQQSLNRKYRSIPNIRTSNKSDILNKRPSYNNISLNKSNTTKSENINKLEILPEVQSKHQPIQTSTPNVKKSIHNKFDDLEKRHAALLKDLNQASRRHERLLARTSRQNLRSS